MTGNRGHTRRGRERIEILAVVVGVCLIGVALYDTFETIVMPRTVTRKIRFTRLFYQLTSRGWRTMANRMHAPDRRESFLGIYGPLSLLLLMTTWAFLLIFAFALVQWGLRQPLRQAGIPLCEGEATSAQLAMMRQSYESYIHALGKRLMLELPPWRVEKDSADNWQRSYWESLRHL
jgi:hypothetical protein